MRINSYPAAVSMYDGSFKRRFFIVNSIEDTAKVCHKMLLENDMNGQYCDLAESHEQIEHMERDMEYSRMGLTARELIDLSEEDVESLPDSLKKHARIIRSSYDRDVARRSSRRSGEVEFMKSLAKIKSMGEDGWSLKDEKGDYMCINLIEERSREHEGYEVQYSESY